MSPTFYNTFQLHIEPILRTGFLLIIGYAVARLLSSALAKALIKHLTPQQAMLQKRFVFYFVMAIFIVAVFDQLGFHIGALLGAAGILTVAIGIASQTSMSNIISGVFMIGEKPFEVGHTIKINDLQGEVLSIDLLSVKMRTLDNTLVRIPNELLIKSAIINLSYFPIRRIDLKIGVAYKENLDQVKAVMMEVADKNLHCLIDPRPSFQILEFGDSSVNLQFSAWCSRPNYTELKTTLQNEIKKAFDEKGIELPFPSRSLFAGSGTNPLPIKIIAS